MPNLTIDVTWLFSPESRLQLGNGLSRAGYADSCLQLDRNNVPYDLGEKVRGAIRQSAEASFRWLVPNVSAEVDDSSAPPPGVLQRIFQSAESGKYWRFGMPVFLPGNGRPTTWSNTAIDPESGIALTDTLRTKETWDNGAKIKFRISAHNLFLTAPAPDEPYTSDWFDALFLIVAIASTEQLGGGRGNGEGELTIESLSVAGNLIDPALAADPGILTQLQEHLGKR